MGFWVEASCREGKKRAKPERVEGQESQQTLEQEQLAVLAYRCSQSGASLEYRPPQVRAARL